MNVITALRQLSLYFLYALLSNLNVYTRPVISVNFRSFSTTASVS